MYKRQTLCSHTEWWDYTELTHFLCYFVIVLFLNFNLWLIEIPLLPLNINFHGPMRKSLGRLNKKCFPIALRCSNMIQNTLLNNQSEQTQIFNRSVFNWCSYKCYLPVQFLPLFDLCEIKNNNNKKTHTCSTPAYSQQLALYSN